MTHFRPSQTKHSSVSHLYALYIQLFCAYIQTATKHVISTRTKTACCRDMENDNNSNNNSHWNREYQQLITTQEEQDGNDRHWTSPNSDSHIAKQHGNVASFLPRDFLLGKPTLCLKRDKIRLALLSMTYRI